ncbi:integral membrane protein [Xanthomonas sp. F1]
MATSRLCATRWDTLYNAGASGRRRRHRVAASFPSLELRVSLSSSRPLSPVGRLFAVAAVFEGLTWAGLLLGMLFKYGTQTTELGVWLFGRLHGVAFLLYVVASLIAALRLRWPWWAWALSLLAALPPLVTVPLELWFRRIGLLGAPGQRAVG